MEQGIKIQIRACQFMRAVRFVGMIRLSSDVSYGIREGVECGMRNAECGMRNAECGIWNLEFGIWNLEYVGGGRLIEKSRNLQCSWGGLLRWRLV